MKSTGPAPSVAVAAVCVAILVSGFGTESLWSAAAGWLNSPQAAAPRLLVLLVADQLRADYLDAYRHRWRGGLRTLLDEGARFTRAEFPYLNTATCVGHVTIGTGTLPRTHGIVLNRWWDRTAGRAVNCMDDESSPHVSYGAAVPFGSSAHRVLAPSLADELRTQRPGARVVSLSLKARSAIGLAGHGGDAVTWFDEAARTFVTSRAFASAPVPGIAAFIARQPPAGDNGQVWTLHEAEGSYRHTDLGAGERPKAGWTAVFPHTVVGGQGVDAQFVDRWQKSPFSDVYLARMAIALVDDFQLGQHGTTDFLAVSFSALDLMGHDFGPDSREVEDMLLRLDDTIAVLLGRLDERIGRDNYVVALTADHGIAPTPEHVGGGRIVSEDLHQVVEQALAARWGRGATPYVAWVSSGSIFFAPGVVDRLRADAASREMVARTLLQVPGMMRVVWNDEIKPDSRDAIIRAAAAGYVKERTADLLLVPKRNWVIELRIENEASNHGTFYEYDRQVPVLLRGHGITHGRFADAVTPADIAPTLAYLAGITMPRADGRLIRSALR